MRCREVIVGLRRARGLGSWGVAGLAGAVLVSGLLVGPQARATHEQPEARGVEQACPPERVAESDFADVAGNPHEDAIACVAWWGVSQGREGSVYDPPASVRRDEMASFVYRTLVAAGVDVPLEPRQAFDDVDWGNAHAQAVNALAELGVVSGFDDGTYRPGRRVRRDQVASFLSRSAAHPLGAALTDEHRWFDDVGEDNPHAPAVNGLAATGVVQGREEGVYAPDLDARRDQMASFLSRLLDVLVAENAATPPRRAQASLTAAGVGEVGDISGLTEQLVGADVGEVTMTERIDGQVEVEASVEGLPEGFHGFHLHETGSCEPDFTAAGGHHNPEGTAHGDHAGDLPVLPVRGDGAGDLAFVTDRVSVDELLADDGTAVVIHAGRDDYANIPERYGGPDEQTRASGDAGPRLACGVLEETPLDAPAEPPQPVGRRRPDDFGHRLEARLENPAGEDVGSFALIPQRDGPPKVAATMTDLPPGGFHGFHLHETGSCEPDFAAAGGHHNPEGTAHGDHAGDLPVLMATKHGQAWLRFHTDRVTEDALMDDDRSAVIVHQHPDNYANIPARYGGPDAQTRTTGDAGDRLACGVLNPVVVDPAPDELSQ